RFVSLSSEGASDVLGAGQPGPPRLGVDCRHDVVWYVSDQDVSHAPSAGARQGLISNDIERAVARPRSNRSRPGHAKIVVIPTSATETRVDTEPEADGGRVLLTGWGRTAPTVADLRPLRHADDAAAVLASPPARGAIARGLGRSYGDAAQNAGGVVLDGTGLDRIEAVDLAAGTVTCGGGVSLDRLMRVLVPLGWFPAVTPGTRHVTVGGAIAADIHGKNHHRDGSFAEHVASLSLAAPAGRFELDPKGDADTQELYWATAGGMGLTGVVTSATLRLTPVETSRIRVDTERAADLDDVLARMESGDDGYRYSVAWIDCLARGRALGRSVLTRGDHATLDDLAPGDRRPERALAFGPAERLTAPPWVPPGLLNRLSVRAFNEAWFRKAPRLERGRIVALHSFF